MKIDEGCINHNVVRLVDELVESRYEFIDSANPTRERANLLLTLGEIGGVLETGKTVEGGAEGMTNQAERIQNAINHIKSSVDIDPWAMEIAVEAMEKELKNSSDAQSVVICGACDNSESAELYLTNPPQIKCKRSGKLHFVTDRCDLPSVQPDIIYCKDCKDYHKIPTGEVWTCRYFRRAVMGNDFCSYAERRTDGSD